jgi:hypothetical protein
MIIVKGDDNALIGWRSPIVIVKEKDVALIGFIIVYLKALCVS